MKKKHAIAMTIIDLSHTILMNEYQRNYTTLTNINSYQQIYEILHLMNV